MAQPLQPVSGISPYGIAGGAILLDRPESEQAYRMQTELKVADNIKDWQIRKNAQQDKVKQKLADLTKDLAVDIKQDKGMLPTVSAALEKQKAEAIEAAVKAQAIGSDPNYGVDSPEYREAERNLLLKKNVMWRTVNDGIQGAELSKDIATKEHDPAKTDIEEIPSMLADFRITPYLDANGQVNKEWTEKFSKLQVLPKLPTMEEDIADNLESAAKSKTTAPETISQKTIIDPKTGEGIMVEQTSTINRDKAEAFTNSHLNDPKKENRVKGVWKKIMSRVDANGNANDPTYLSYLQKSKDKTINPNGLDPMGLWLRDKYEAMSVDREIRKDMGMPYATKKEIDFGYGQKEEELAGGALLERADAYIMGAPKYLESGKDYFNNTTVKVRGLDGIVIGQTIDSKGEKMPDQVTDNYRAANGNVYIQTNSSFNRALKMAQDRAKSDGVILADGEMPDKKYFRSEDLYIPINSTTKMYHLLTGGIDDPAKKGKVDDGTIRYAQKKGVSTDGVTFKTGGLYKKNKADDEIRDRIYQGAGRSAPLITTEQKQKFFGTGKSEQQPAPQQTKPSAVKKESQEISEQDKAAMEWLKANPNAPQAEAIRKTLKAKGLIK